MNITSKVFKSGDALLMELPSGLNIKPKTYRIEQTNHGFEVIDVELRERHLRELRREFSTPCEAPAELVQ